jgi:hypothetical protein
MAPSMNCKNIIANVMPFNKIRGQLAAVNFEKKPINKQLSSLIVAWSFGGRPMRLSLAVILFCLTRSEIIVKCNPTT